MSEVKISVKYQYLSMIRMNLLALGYGSIVGWSSPSLPVLLSQESPLDTGPITPDDASWIGSLLCIGAIIGTLFFGWIIERFGTKIAGCINALPIIAFWLLVLFGNSVYVLYFARFVGGFSGGGAFVLMPIYIVDIAEDKIRGALGSILMFAVNLGILLSFIAGSFLLYRVVPCVMLTVPIGFLISFFFFPERSQSTMKRNLHKVVKSLESEEEDHSQEIHIAINSLNKKSINYNINESGNITFAELVMPTTRKSIIICFALVIFNQLSGCFILLSYTASIFKEAGSNFSPNMSTIIIGIVKIIGSCLSIVLVERCGRKILYIVSALGTAIGLSVMATYTYLNINGYNMHLYSWIPVISLSFVILIASIGILPLTFVVLSELLPNRIRGVITTFCICCFHGASFIVLKYYGLLAESIGIYGAFWLFSGCCLFAIVFYAILIPETKGKSIDEIQESLK